MLTFSGGLRVFLALEPCDMRKGFDGLAGLVIVRKCHYCSIALLEELPS